MKILNSFSFPFFRQEGHHPPKSEGARTPLINVRPDQIRIEFRSGVSNKLQKCFFCFQWRLTELFLGGTLRAFVSILFDSVQQTPKRKKKRRGGKKQIKTNTKTPWKPWKPSSKRIMIWFSTVRSCTSSLNHLYLLYVELVINDEIN